MKPLFILGLCGGIAALGIALFWHQLTPPTCPDNGLALTRVQALSAARVYTAHQINDLTAMQRDLMPDTPDPDPPVTGARIAQLQPDCCQLMWDLTRSHRRHLARRARPEFVDQLGTFVRVRITASPLLPPTTRELSFVVPVTACGQAETIVRSGDGWVPWTPPPHL